MEGHTHIAYPDLTNLLIEALHATLYIAGENDDNYEKRKEEILKNSKNDLQRENELIRLRNMHSIGLI